MVLPGFPGSAFYFVDVDDVDNVDLAVDDVYMRPMVACSSVFGSCFLPWRKHEFFAIGNNEGWLGAGCSRA